MKTKFRNRLTNWYSLNKRELPWRLTKDPYKIWLSEIILQQTQVKQGLPYYKQFVEHYPTVHKLALASEDEVLKLWQGLGYYSRARNLHETAKKVAFEMNSVFPANYKGLVKLKGVGDYTASAIASICYDEATAVVDGNVYRFLSRYFGIESPVDSSSGKREFKELAQSLLPEENIGDHNQAVMEFGARQCKPRNPDCPACPFNDSCFALQNNVINKLPVKTGKTPVKNRYFNYVVLRSADGKTRVEKREESGIWQNLYQFPLIESNNPLSEAEFGTHPELKTMVTEDKFDYRLHNDRDIVHKLSHQHLHTRFWIVDTSAQLEDGIPASRLNELAVPALIARFLEEFDF